MHKLLAAALALSFVGCAHPFSKIQPGMTTAEVRAVTGEYSPTQVVPYGPTSAAWFYGPDQCILVMEDRVSMKDVTHTDAAFSAPGIGGLSVERKPVCAPPGVQVQGQSRTNVYIPGVGAASVNGQ
jgi:hypothetical protein